MTVHLGILALMIAIIAGATFRMRRRRTASDLLLVVLAVASAALETGIAVSEARFDSQWDEISRRELVARSERIVDFLREKGSAALGEIRGIGSDPDTHALLRSQRAARRPVFLDLGERFPPGGPRGVTVYDLRGTPRAWSGWAPTATTSLVREPSRELESVAIRNGNIYTLLEAIHPVRDEDGNALGYVVHQEPLRVQFPLENDLLKVDDVLAGLEGGGGVRADVALELRIDADADIRSIRPGALKRIVDGPSASGTVAIVTPTGEPVGRVSLAGLARGAMLHDERARFALLRFALLFILLAIGFLRLWFHSARLPGPLAAVTRLTLLVAARWVLFVALERAAFDPLDLFDPGWFASIRYGGLLRSPGDLALTGAALLFAVREVRRLVASQGERLSAFGARHPVLAAPFGLVSALLIGSVVGFHWKQVTGITGTANVALFEGWDPFQSTAASALELALLFLGVAMLLAADGLGDIALRLLSRWRRPFAIAGVGAVALLASAVKMGDPTQVALGDILRPLPAIAALALFHLMRAADRRRGGAAILATALLAAVANSAPVAAGVDARRRVLVELEANGRTEIPSNSRQIDLDETLDYLSRKDELLSVLESTPGPESSNLAFILWAKSPLASLPAGSDLRIRDATGRAFSRFSLGFPAELRAADAVADSLSLPGRRRVSFRRQEIGVQRVDTYAGSAPILRGSRVLGYLEITMAYPDDLTRSAERYTDVSRVFTNRPPPSEFLRFTREVPERVTRYRGETLVASTDPEGGLGTRIHPTIVRALEGRSASGTWVPREIRGQKWNLYCVRERDGEVTVGYLTFGIRERTPVQIAWFVVRCALVTLVLAAGLLVALVVASRLLPRGEFPHRLDLPRPGFRERVIGGFLLVSLLPTLLLGWAGKQLIEREKRGEFVERLEGDLRTSRELLGSRLSDAARNAAGAVEVTELFAERVPYRTLSTPASVGGILVMSADGKLLGASRSADLDLAILPMELESLDAPLEFFRRRGGELFACVLVPVPAGAKHASGGAVLAFQRIDEVIAAELERRAGSIVSFFAGGQLAATSRPELYQSEILSDLAESVAYQKVELEAARQTLREQRVGRTSFLSSYAPLLDAQREPVGILATVTAYHTGGLDSGASEIFSRIYFVCLLVLAAAIAVAFVMAGRLTRPISELTRGSERIRAGELGVRVRTRATGEIGRLVRSFNQMSEQLAESEARDRERREYIEAIIRHVGSGVVSVDAQGRVATVNEAASRILRVDPGALLGASAADVRGDAALEAVLSSVQPLLSGQDSAVVTEVDVEIPGAEEDDDLRSFRLVATPLFDSDGKPQGAVAVFEDLTDLIRSKKITAWAEMARQVAHEIKNPLTPMKLSAQQLRAAWRDRHPRFDRILEESTEMIVDRCEALRRIAVEFSDYARMPGRRIRREELGRLLREARKLYGEQENAAVEFRLDLPGDELYARVDRDEVMRLFINLFENSMQAMPSGGQLDVRAERSNGSARVTIHDTGVGIPPENLRRIFEPSFSTKTGGAGLGLPICRAIMQDYGGSIEIESTGAAGTTVTLSFPVDDRSAS